ncbi:Hypothetical protein AA314_09545 [Archangium gephyra]|uniref:Uncharacterized protein n=1 Tax=Archangium gephyra TaxID=48 RepID=A0AAC8QI39_9BACT|nr:Hypothetical protein AA314_09545 [Archangium gephyra]
MPRVGLLLPICHPAPGYDGSLAHRTLPRVCGGGPLEPVD